MARELLQVFPALVHGPEVHRAVAITQEVDPMVPPHGVFAGTGVVRGQRNGLASAGETPDILSRSALVTFGLAALKRHASEKERLICILENALRRLAEGHQFDAILRVDGS